MHTEKVSRGVKTMKVLNEPATVVCHDERSGLSVVSGYANPGKDKKDEKRLLNIMNEDSGEQCVSSPDAVLEIAENMLDELRKEVDESDGNREWSSPCKGRGKKKCVLTIKQIRKIYRVKKKDCPYIPMTKDQANAIRQVLTMGLWKRITWRTIFKFDELKDMSISKQDALGIFPSVAAVTDMAECASASHIRKAVDEVKGKGLCDRDEMLSICDLSMPRANAIMYRYKNW